MGLAAGRGGVSPLREVGIPTSQGPAWHRDIPGCQWQPLQNTHAEPRTRLLLAFASSLFPVDAVVKARGGKYQQGCGA